MQIPSIPPPIMNAPMTQEVVVRTAATVQAAPPIIERAIDPSPKSEKFNQTGRGRDGSNRQRRDEGEPDKKDPNERGQSINLHV